MKFDVDSLDFSKSNGLVTVVAQHAESGVVLMVAHADREALAQCVATGEMHYRSRTRGLWHKGATSGNTQRIISLAPDCDGDSVLARVIPAGPACHTATLSCFGESALDADALGSLARTIRSRMTNEDQAAEGDGSYTRRLLHDRNLRLKKIGEEAAEAVIACADEEPGRAAEEGADLIYHLMVALQVLNISIDDVRAVLFKRARGHPST